MDFVNQIIHGDCLEVMKDIPDKSVDLVVTDPPYTMTKRGKSCRPNWMPDKMGDNVFSGDLPNVETWMGEVYRVLKDATHFYTFCNINDITSYLSTAQGVGFKLHNIISMVKDTGMPNRWYYKQTELILFFRKGRAKPINDYTSRDNVKVTMPKVKTGKLHVTQKPLDLIEELVLNSSVAGELVLDPFVGSGTTAIAAINTGRQFIGIEKEERYVEISRERIRTLVDGGGK